MDAINILIDQFKDLNPVLHEHLESNGELLPHVYFGECNEFFINYFNEELQVLSFSGPYLKKGDGGPIKIKPMTACSFVAELVNKDIFAYEVRVTLFDTTEDVVVTSQGIEKSVFSYRLPSIKPTGKMVIVELRIGKVQRHYKKIRPARSGGTDTSAFFSANAVTTGK
ncbi:hypothetical protein V7161_28440 [Neobacillus drentensis]|uniref:hypothetical protein n=1 Tax=Neobacillus drentensis TaxID=220684 RepID=UPI0030033CC5